MQKKYIKTEHSTPNSATRKYIIIGGAIALLVIAFCAISYYSKIKINLAVACNKDACHENVFLLHGEVKSGSWPLVLVGIKYMTTQHPEIKTICISSQGGEVSDAIMIADAIYANGLNTCLASRYELSEDRHLSVDGLCQSSCTWMILAGKDRILYDDKIELGFHAARDNSGNRSDDDLPMLINKVKNYVSRRPDPLTETKKLSRLSWWAFQQGTKRETTNCTAHELQSKYPYFTDVRSWNTAPARSCGLKAPEDVQEILDLEVHLYGFEANQIS